MGSHSMTGYRQVLSRFFMLLAFLSEPQASQLSDLKDQLPSEAPASFFTPHSQKIDNRAEEIQSLSYFVEAGKNRTLDQFLAAANDILAMIQERKAAEVLTNLEGVQLETFLDIAPKFLDKQPDGDAFDALLRISFLLKLYKGPELYRDLLLKQNEPDTNTIMAEVKTVFYTPKGEHRQTLTASDVDWILALEEQKMINDPEFADFLWRAQNWKNPSKKAQSLPSENDSPPKQRWGSKGYRNEQREFNNGRGGNKRPRSHSNL